MASRDTKKRQQVERDMLLKVLSTFEGRHVLYGVLSKGGIYSSPPLEPMAAQRELGRKDVALELLQELLTVNPEVYILMQQEAARFEMDYKVTQKEDGEEDDG